MLSVQLVRRKNLAGFLRYVAAHGSEHDESFLPGAGYAPSDDHPAYVLLRGTEIVGAASLMRSARYRSVRRGRFSFFHCVDPAPPLYALLFDAIRRHLHRLDSVYLFLPEGCRASQPLLQLGFTIERYSYVMKLDTFPPRGLALPRGMALVPVASSERHATQLFADAINANFRELAGHIPMQAGRIREWEADECFLPEGIVLLMDGRRAAGTVSITRDVDDAGAAEIGALSVAGERRGEGLGRVLLRHAVCFAAWHGLHPVYLSLNAENSRALRLYESEGFVVTATMVCYARAC
jgi:ribosomal protein S18 acetylase RimI-like enzyme